MSHSIRHTPIFGNTGSKSSKSYKAALHGRERARVRELIVHGKYDEAEVELAPWNAWDDPRDGKVYHANFYPRRGWGVHLFGSWNYLNNTWNKESADEHFKKAMRK